MLAASGSPNLTSQRLSVSQLGLTLMSASLAKDKWRPQDAQVGATGRGRFIGCVVEEFFLFETALAKVLDSSAAAGVALPLTERRPSRRRSVRRGPPAQRRWCIASGGGARVSTTCARHTASSRGLSEAARNNRESCAVSPKNRDSAQTRRQVYGVEWRRVCFSWISIERDLEASA